jgi:hypothetical protein
MPQKPSSAQKSLQQSLSDTQVSLSSWQLVTGRPQAPSDAQRNEQQSASTEQGASSGAHSTTTTV